MSWDLRLNSNRDIRSGYVTESDEVLQRIGTRLMREFGEWFLDATVGIPWYQGGEGLLGSQDVEIMDILVQKTIKETEGVKRVLKFNPAWSPSTRQYRYYVLIELEDGLSYNVTFAPSNEGGLQWQAAV